MSELIDELEKKIAECDKDDVKRFVRSEMKEEVDGLIEDYNDKFGDVSDDDPLKIKVKAFLAELGIVVK